ncbi:MAG: leucine-rich repeat protein, partial [Ruminiclostridium sp.]|nr:leucine-rich repeat protein [Ruminiclostridium sp.]
MKKILLGIAVFFTMAIMCIISASAETDGDYTYTVLSDGTVSITKYNGTATELAIPSVIDGKTVTTIGENCFSNNASLTSIVMPDTVLYAEKGAFMWCSKLTNITLSANLKTLGNNALRGNSLITSLKLPKTLESIGVDAFSLMNGLQSITVADDNNYFKTVDGVLYNKEMTQIILYPCQKTDTSYTMPDTVTEMSDKCFEYAKNLETITLSKNLTAISRYAFSDCRKLKSLTIPEGVTSIGDYAFKQSSALTTVHLPSTLTTIGDSLFFNNFHFTGFTINENNETFSVEDGILFNKDKTQLLIYPMGKPDKSYAVPESVTDIADHAFYYAAYIEKLSFGSKLNSFGNWTFSGCDSLTEVVIPESLTDFGRATFDGCDNLTEITIPSKVTKLSDYTFRDCGKLAKIEIKGTIKEILSYCFSGTPITSISFPAGLEKVDYGAFYNCSNLTDVNLPDTIIYMGHDVFENTPFQNNNPDKLKYAGNVLYHIDPETTIADVKEGTTVFASKILDDCTKLEEIILPDSLIHINDSAFSRCKTIKKITLGSNTQTIGQNAFYYCQALEEIKIPDSVTSIGKYAFAYCSSLVSVVIPDSLESLSEYTFSECTSLVSVVVPGNVKTIEAYCFKNCTALESAVLCRGVTELGSYTFRGCTSLKSLRIPDGVTTLYGTVYNCHGLEKLTVPDSALYFDGVVIAGVPKTVSIHGSADSAFYNYINERYTEIITTGQYQKIDELTAISLCTAPTTTSIVFTWNATPVTEGVEIQQLVNGTWTTVATVKNGSLGTYTLSGLTQATEYSFRARTYTGSGDTALYSAYTYKNTATEIEKITGFTSSDVTDNSLKLTWDKNSTATGYIVKQYKNGEWVKLADTTSCTYTVSGLSSCTDYVFSVTAYTTSGTGKLTSAPSRINVTTDHVYSSSFTIDKAATCTTEGSKSRHCTREGCNAKTSVTVIPMKGHSYTDTVVAPTYTEQGYTLHDCDNCDYSYKDDYKDKLALLKPVVTATAGDKQVTLSWTAVSGASYYQIIRYNKGTYSVVADINSTSAVVKGLTNNYEYTYLVKAVAEDGRSSLSSAVYVTPVAPLSKPVVTATAGDKQATLSW